MKGRRFRVAWVARSQHEGSPVTCTVQLVPVENERGNTHNSLSFHLDSDLPPGVELGSLFELTPVDGQWEEA